VKPSGMDVGEAHVAALVELLVNDSTLPVHERITQALQDALTLRLFPGRRLPPERHLADLLGVSRVTVRQSLRSLRERGWIDRSARGRSGGSAVLPRSELSDREWYELLDRADVDIADNLTFRLIIEPPAARLAAARADATLGARLLASVEALAASQDAESFRASDSEFHLAIAEAAGNRRLLRSLLVSRAELYRWRDLLRMPYYPGRNEVEHREIAIAIAAGDAERAAVAMTQHLQQAQESFWQDVLTYRRAERRGPWPQSRGDTV